MATWNSRLGDIARGIKPHAAAVVAETVEDIVAGAHRRAPVGSTGDLKAGWEAELDGLQGQAKNDVWYAHFVEGGTRHAAARPMLVPAVEEAREAFRRRIRRSVIR
jgi:hypothetical protein